MIVRISN